MQFLVVSLVYLFIFLWSVLFLNDLILTQVFINLSKVVHGMGVGQLKPIHKESRERQRD